MSKHTPIHPAAAARRTFAALRHTPIWLAVVVVALVTAAGAVVAGTSLAASGTPAASAASSTTPAATGADTPPANLGQNLLDYSACMRAHGVANFPDPQIQQSGQQVSATIHLTPAITSSPAFESAQASCARSVPDAPPANPPTAGAVRQQQQAALAFVGCMRGHGFPDFPGPTANGQLTPEMVTAAGIDLHEPALLQAGLGCVSVTHGLLTPADIQRAVNTG